MGNNVKSETVATINAAISRALKSQDALSTATVDRFADYATSTDYIVARMAYVVQARGIGTMDGKESLQTFADRIDRKRPSMSQYAKMVAWLTDSATTVTAVTFGNARTLYGRGKESRKMVADNLATIAEMATDADRAAAWQAMVDAPAPTATADAGKATGDATTGEGEDDTRDARVNVPTPTMTRAEWIDTLDALATAVVLLSDATDAERAHIGDALATIAARVGTTVDA